MRLCLVVDVQGRGSMLYMKLVQRSALIALVSTLVFCSMAGEQAIADAIDPKIAELIKKNIRTDFEQCSVSGATCTQLKAACAADFVLQEKQENCFAGFLTQLHGIPAVCYVDNMDAGVEAHNKCVSENIAAFQSLFAFSKKYAGAGPGYHNYAVNVCEPLHRISNMDMTLGSIEVWLFRYHPFWECVKEVWKKKLME